MAGRTSTCPPSLYGCAEDILGAVTLTLQPNAIAPAVLVKGGLNSATRALALELAPYNVKVTAIADPPHTPEIA